MEKIKKNSLLNRRRQAVADTLTPYVYGRRLFEHLCLQSGNLKWKYLVLIKRNDTDWNDWTIINHEEFSSEVKILREFGIGKIFFSKTWCAVVEDKSLVLMKIILGDRIVLIYDIHSDKIIWAT